MKESTLNLLVIGTVALLGLLIFFVIRYRQGLAEHRLAQLAAANGWQMERVSLPLLRGVRFSAAHWQLEAMSRSSGRHAGPASTNLKQSTRWTSDHPGSTLLIGPLLSAHTTPGAMGEMLKQQVLQFALGADAAGVDEMAWGGSAFQKSYMAMARYGEDVDTILSPEVERILVAWQGQKPLIKRTSHGLAIELQGVHAKSAAELLSLIELGELLLANLGEEKME